MIPPFIGAVLVMAGLIAVVRGLAPRRRIRVQDLGRASAAARLGAHDTRRPSRITALARTYTPTPRVDRLELLYQQAGQPAGWDVDRVLRMKFLGGTSFGLLGLLMMVSKPGALSVMLLMVGTMGGFMGPDVLLGGRAQRRRQAVQFALPNGIDQLSISVRAGLSLDASIVRLSESSEGPLAEELTRVAQDMRVGLSRSDALKSFAERIDIPELHLFVRALVQSTTLGVPISATLAAQADELRLRRRQHAEESAMKLPVKILAPTVLCILPALMLVVLGPAVIQLMDNLKL